MSDVYYSLQSKETEKNTVVTPSNSYGLNNNETRNSEHKLAFETQIESSSRDFIRLQSECLDRELQGNLEGIFII